MFFYCCSLYQYQSFMRYRGAKIELQKKWDRKILCEWHHPFCCHPIIPLFVIFLSTPSPLSKGLTFWMTSVSFCPVEIVFLDQYWWHGSWHQWVELGLRSKQFLMFVSRDLWSICLIDKNSLLSLDAPELPKGLWNLSILSAPIPRVFRNILENKSKCSFFPT